VEHGADINKEDNDGVTPLFISCKEGHENVVKYLMEHGENINEKKSNGENINEKRSNDENIKHKKENDDDDKGDSKKKKFRTGL